MFKPSEEGLQYSLEANNVYTVKVDYYKDEVFLEKGTNFTLPEKIYTTENDIKFINKTLNHFKNNTGTTGVLLSGLKGSGKTLTIKKIAIKSKLPIIIIDKAIKPNYIVRLINNLESVDACIVIDEVDKLEKEYDECLLKILDGITNSGNKLFLLTCNNEANLNQYLKNRCSRIRYWKKFKELSPALVDLIIKDKLNNKEKANEVLDFIIDKFSCISFDNVCSFIIEVNENPDEILDDLFIDMNLS